MPGLRVLSGINGQENQQQRIDQDNSADDRNECIPSIHAAPSLLPPMGVRDENFLLPIRKTASARTMITAMISHDVR